MTMETLIASHGWNSHIPIIMAMIIIRYYQAYEISMILHHISSMFLSLSILTHSIHGAAIYGNIYHQCTPNVNISAPWIRHGLFSMTGVSPGEISMVSPPWFRRLWTSWSSDGSHSLIAYAEPGHDSTGRRRGYLFGGRRLVENGSKLAWLKVNLCEFYGHLWFRSIFKYSSMLNKQINYMVSIGFMNV